MLTLDKVYHARYVLRDVARQTDLILAPKIAPGREVFLKTENLQNTGSFKLRGAYYKISQLTEEERKHGVVACSRAIMHRGLRWLPQPTAFPPSSACRTVLPFPKSKPPRPMAPR